ncbi:hypothetical protein SKAU_G00395720 [Synaphobranchus kaupii]|uniref:Uncharacterized protein n=1 Tax=Synaphobranchus kaupii TaxID=118154 RepID=A0A9Q1ECD2_SYNKA|nr:hypothetical protein SKAU_G00395720 [Synaphobranchus kaupii]
MNSDLRGWCSTGVSRRLRVLVLWSFNGDACSPTLPDCGTTESKLPHPAGVKNSALSVFGLHSINGAGSEQRGPMCKQLAGFPEQRLAEGRRSPGCPRNRAGTGPGRAQQEAALVPIAVEPYAVFPHALEAPTGAIKPACAVSCAVTQMHEM